MQIKMEQNNNHKFINKQKKCLSKILLPNKIPNKVGVIISRSQSAKETNINSKINVNKTNQQKQQQQETDELNKISKRPLSLNISNLRTKKDFSQMTSPLTRSASVSENNVTTIIDDRNLLRVPNENELIENLSLSYESVVKVPTSTSSSLHLIPTVKARQRNFLHGKIGANSLLGSNELDRIFPNRQITIFVGTWNMNGHTPPKELNDFVLPIGVEHVPDILVFGTQESCSERFEWEVCLQETLGPSHLLFHSNSLGTLHLSIFLRRDLIWYVSIVEDASLSVRPGTAFRTKGAVASAFMLFGTSFLFVTAHLTAHQEKVKERVADVKKIVNSLDLPKLLPCKNKSKDVTQNFDYVFWSGDLNFRLSTPRSKVLEWLSHTKFPLPEHLPHGYLHHDQLCSVLSDGAAFKGFSEAKIIFPPTYKYDPGTQNFDTSSKQRTPAYTDRILYKQKSGRRFSGQHEPPPLQCLIYDSVSSITTSDHKPVWGVFKVHLKPGLDTIPLAAGLFNRDVYLEGLRRRATTLNDSKGATTVCSLQ